MHDAPGWFFKRLRRQHVPELIYSKYHHSSPFCFTFSLILLASLPLAYVLLAGLAAAALHTGFLPALLSVLCPCRLGCATRACYNNLRSILLVVLLPHSAFAGRCGKGRNPHLPRGPGRLVLALAVHLPGRPCSLRFAWTFVRFILSSTAVRFVG